MNVIPESTIEYLSKRHKKTERDSIISTVDSSLATLVNHINNMSVGNLDFIIHHARLERYRPVKTRVYFGISFVVKSSRERLSHNDYESFYETESLFRDEIVKLVKKEISRIKKAWINVNLNQSGIVHMYICYRG